MSERPAPPTMSIHFRMIGTIVQRELRDNLRDWRLVGPIAVLTLFFPLLMGVAIREALAFVSRYGGDILAWQLVPFMLMIVGFFPISFSLVIALETFVGEKERNSLEPLLATPISDEELYLGKMLAATILPVVASYIGIFVYVLGLQLTMHYLPPVSLLVQIIMLTTLHALVMVAGAVVISSHTTSVRAANLLASFIIVPMAILVQGESFLMFWATYEALWWIAAGLLIVAILLVRLGFHLFNREEILSRGMDRIHIARIWATFKDQFLKPAAAGGRRFTLWRVYRYDLPRLILESRLAIVMVLAALTLSALIGVYLASKYQLPAQVLEISRLPREMFENLPNFDFLPPLTTAGIFLNNVRALAIAGVAGLFSFGTLAVVLLMIPIGAIGYLGASFALAGQSVIRFLVAFILPHGILELPAAILATAAALRMGATIVAPPSDERAGQRVLRALADFIKLFIFLILPLLLAAAFLEANLTPQVVIYMYGL